MSRAVNNLSPLCPNNVYIAHPSILSEAQHFNITLSQLLQGCNFPTPSLQPGQIIFFPTFFGDYNFGHWYLTILLHDNDCITGYIFDSLGHSTRRITFVDNIFCSCGIQVDWRYCVSIRQTKVEYDPRTVMNIWDLVKRLHDREPIHDAIRNMSEYEADRHIISHQSHAWMHGAVTNTLPCPFTFYIETSHREPNTPVTSVSTTTKTGSPIASSDRVTLPQTSRHIHDNNQNNVP